MLCTCMRFFSDLLPEFATDGELWNGGWENVVVFVVVDDDGGVGGVEGRGGAGGSSNIFPIGR